jgi:hypothetical protein
VLLVHDSLTFIQSGGRLCATDGAGRLSGLLPVGRVQVEGDTGHQLPGSLARAGPVVTPNPAEQSNSWAPDMVMCATPASTTRRNRTEAACRT